mmetsp:Transcript_37459/g.79357  ORF Transcript_37459/g.79357 Transcript_37459/m.79357 type:complete len:367 (-) Transcript_37459:233-1333(-)
MRSADRRSILFQHSAQFAFRDLGGWRPRCFSCRKLIFRDLEIKRQLVTIKANDVPVLNQGNRASISRFGGDVADHQAVGCPAEPAVRNQRYVLAQAPAHEGTARGEHLGHAGCSLGAFISNHQYIALNDIAIHDRCESVVFAVVNLGRPRNLNVLLPTQLAYSTFRSQVPLQYLNVVARWTKRRGARIQYILRPQRLQIRHVLQIIGDCPSRDRHAVAMHQSVLHELLHDHWNTTKLIQIHHMVRAVGSQVADQRDPLADGMKISDCKIHLGFMGNSQHVQYGISRTTQSIHHCHCILQGLFGHDISWSHIGRHQVENSSSNIRAILLLLLGGVVFSVHRSVRRGAWQRHAQSFDSACHGARSEHR